jgi:hypothetical protein
MLNAKFPLKKNKLENIEGDLEWRAAGAGEIGEIDGFSRDQRE